ncbi:MAG: S8 family serine peptidase [Chitinophagaceae bacterium]|nr:S8 family serine peptidase [Chitinophagaceae bacterium]
MSKKAKKEENLQVEYTGRYLVLLPAQNPAVNAVSTINEVSGLNLISSATFENEVFTTEDLDACDGILLENIGVAIVNKNPKFTNSIAVLADDHQMIIEPERVVYAINKLNEETESYVKGYRDAVNALADILTEEPQADLEELSDAEGIEANALAGATWGLKATQVIPSSFLFTNPYSGAGAKVAILDTGMDFAHPDFAGRAIIERSFIPGQATQDVFGHGTHCIGTSCGPKTPVSPVVRYGIAYGAQIFAGKVLNNNGGGTDGQILAGINWAYGQGCSIISMSLGGASAGAGFSQVFEATAANLLNNGTLIVAAAGNDSNRPGTIRPVSHPANCPSIMAVGAVDENMNMAYFSNGGLFPAYGAVDIVGPGAAVFSALSTPHSIRMGPAGIIHGNCNGTSMATPHVAGIAALWHQATGLRGRALWNKLTATAKPLPQHPRRDVGAGLVQAPKKRRVIKFPPFQRF